MRRWMQRHFRHVDDPGTGEYPSGETGANRGPTKGTQTSAHRPSKNMARDAPCRRETRGDERSKDGPSEERERSRSDQALPAEDQPEPVAAHSQKVMMFPCTS